MNLLWQGAWPLMRMMSGFILWAVCFVVLYGGMSLACAYGAPSGSFAGLHAINWLLAALWLAHLVPLAWLALYSFRACRAAAPEAAPGVRFTLHASWLTNLAALVATVWVGFPVLLMVPCA